LVGLQLQLQLHARLPSLPFDASKGDPAYSIHERCLLVDIRNPPLFRASPLGEGN
jgi:hypothetical protein